MDRKQSTDNQNDDCNDIRDIFLAALAFFDRETDSCYVSKLPVLTLLAEVFVTRGEKQLQHLPKLLYVMLDIVLRIGGVQFAQSEINEFDILPIASDKDIATLEMEPERGKRCLECFKHRLCVTAEYAAANGFDMFTTTLASSRWKDINQINEAGRYAEQIFPGSRFWDKNWRKGGLYERRNQLLKIENFFIIY